VQRRSLLLAKFAALALLAVPIAPYAVAAAPTPSEQTLAAVRALQADDARLLAIGFRLATANAPFCAETRPATGLLLIDAATYKSAAAIRTAWGIKGDFAVEAIAPGSPAAAAGIVPGQEVLAIAGQAVSGTSFGPAGAADRIDRIFDRLEDAIVAGGKTSLATPLRTAELGGVPACRSRFELLTDGSGARADGRKVQISRKLFGQSADDSEAAFVVAHELAHNVLRHRARLAAEGRSAANVRATEREADRLAVWLMANAGYDPAAAPRFLRRWGAKGLLSPFQEPSHDRAEARARLVEDEIASLSDETLRDWRSRFILYQPEPRTSR